MREKFYYTAEEKRCKWNLAYPVSLQRLERGKSQDAEKGIQDQKRGGGLALSVSAPAGRGHLHDIWSMLGNL